MVVEALLIIFLPGDKQILIDTRKYDQQIVLPIPSFSWFRLAEMIPLCG
jgi:hypothetical protein